MCSVSNIGMECMCCVTMWCTHTHTHTHAHTHTYTHTHTRTYTHTHTYTCMHTHSHTHMHTMHATHTHIHTSTHTVTGGGARTHLWVCSIQYPWEKPPAPTLPPVPPPHGRGGSLPTNHQQDTSQGTTTVSTVTCVCDHHVCVSVKV